MTSPALVAAAQLKDELRIQGTPDRAVHERAYLKSNLEHLGVRVPVVRQTVRSWAKRNQLNSHDLVIDFADALWRTPVYELRLSSVELLKARVRLLGPPDLPACEVRIREARTWALVDPTAIDVAGSITASWPSQSDTGATLDRWSIDSDFWVRRASMLTQLPTARQPASDMSRFLRYADAMLDESEFFIRKAIGWVLRELSRRQPEVVVTWLQPRLYRASGVTLREAVRRLPDDQRDQLLKSRDAL